uniref:von Willebrand factor D and EGF domain-containing protein-like isoform X2 n=1 Tax=Crassostrea virginica TaxID=6565 RepID=A0A8B8AEH2_CRAVI|nr:von Willebrand factor D and EGF domain-containing protein-like isoform X2 [Crassostrea virginica]
MAVQDKDVFSYVQMHYCLGFILFALHYSVSQDPCDGGNALTLKFLTKRSPSYAMDSAPLCDRYITETWYRAEGYTMTTSPPPLRYCGTLYPVWLSGTIPPIGVSQTLTACEVGFSSNCARRYPIEVKNCTNFLVYKLKALDLCNSAYCFDLYEDCVNETVSDVGVTFHNITWHSTSRQGVVQHDPSINLLCSFNPSADDTLLYHIDWYVDNDTVIQGQTVDKNSLQDAILSAEDMHKAGKKINCWIHCIVGIKRAESNNPCFSNSSELFFAGFEILNPTLTIERKGNASLMIRPTIPFAAEVIEFNTGIQISLVIDISVSVSEDAIEKCSQQSSGGFTSCNIAITGYSENNKHMYEEQTNWRKTYSIDVSNKDEEGYYMANHRLLLRLQTGGVNGRGAQIFSDVIFHDIHINVVENQDGWKGKVCKSHGDPYLTTFDGIYYSCQETGCVIGNTYILYQNENHLQEVQVRHERCWNGRCVCGVAVRAGQDVFIIDFCSGRQFISFPICNENSIKAVKESDKIYKIILPTGTFVKAEFRNFDGNPFFLDIDIYPTVADFAQTSGLCGFLDNNRENDLRHKDGTEDARKYPGAEYNEFTLSWQLSIGSTSDLLSYSQAVFDQLQPLSSYTNKLCTCVDGKTYCSYKLYSECKTNTTGKEYHCVLHSSNRKKRDLTYLLNPEMKQKEKKLKVERVKRQTFSAIDAFNICDEAFQQSGYYNTCLEAVPNFSNETLLNCISDLTLTGIQTLTHWHLSTALSQCQTFIRLNSSLLTDNSSETSYEYIVNHCQNNCSNNGVCSNGKCICESGFGGSDCSFDVLSLPTITRLSDNGLCDKSNEPCDDITLYGYYFLENMNTTCYVIREEVNMSNVAVSTTFYNVPLEERTLFEGYCSLQYNQETSWITRFNFNISNHDMQYSNTYSVYVYQSNCQIFQNDTGNIHFDLQTGYCFINGTCIHDGTSKQNSDCWKCRPEIDLYGWTMEWETLETSTNIQNQTSLSEDFDENKKHEKQNTEVALETIGLIAAVTVVILALIVTGVLIIKKCINRHKKGICDVTTNAQNEDAIYPENKKGISMKGNFNPAYQLHFESPKEK